MKVLLTGGTGSFGQAFVRMALAAHAERVVVYSRDEVKQGDMLDRLGHEPAFRAFLGDIRDQTRLEQAMYGCDTVIHAAALKRISSVYSAGELLRTNVMGTMNVVEAAWKQHVARVVILSSDKAVEATNLYGTTKACAEGYAVQANSYTHPQGTRVSVVRYGNVLASRGSVLERWARQVANSVPLDVTDPRMTRYLLTLGQAVQIVDAALGWMRGGEIFVPVLPAATIGDLAEAAYPGHPVTVTGVRAGGEKHHEQLLSREEVHRVRVLAPSLRYVEPAYVTWTTAAWIGERAAPSVETSETARRLNVEALRTWLVQEHLI